MAPKNKSNKKSKASVDKTAQQTAADMNNAYTSVIQGVISAGFSAKEAEAAYDKFWSQGGDVDNIDLTVARLIRILKNQNEANSRQKMDVKKLEADAANPAEKELLHILGLPSISNTLSELVSWFNKSSSEARKLLTAPMLDSLYLRILQQKAWNVPSSLLSTFFRVVYSLPSEVSGLLSAALEALQRYAVDLPLSLSECLSLFESVLANVSSSASSSVIHLANLWGLLDETNKTTASIAGDDPKSQFMRRDNLYKALDLRLDAFSLASALTETEMNQSLQTIDLPTALHTPPNAEDSIKEKQKLQEELEQIRVHDEELTRSIEAEITQQQTKVDELTARRDALRKELEIVEKQLESTTKQLQDSQNRLQDCRKSSKQKLESLEKKTSNVSFLASQAVACKAVEEAFDAVQQREETFVQAVPTFVNEMKDEAVLLQSIKQYLESEVTCVTFLQNRSTTNKAEVDTLFAELQHETATEEKLSRVAKLRRLIASDRDAMNALIGFASGIERRLSAIIDGPKAEAHKDALVPIYVLLFQLHVPKTITVEVYNVLADAVNAALPKPAPKLTPKPKEEKPKEEVKETKRPAQPMKKWGIIKQHEVKSVDAIREEIQASRHSRVF